MVFENKIIINNEPIVQKLCIRGERERDILKTEFHDFNIYFRQTNKQNIFNFGRRILVGNI